MKRRDMLKGAAAVAGASVVGLPAVAGAQPCCERDHDGDGNCDRHPERVHIRFELTLPGPYDKLAKQLQEGIEGLEAMWPDMKVDLPVDFEVLDKDGERCPATEGDGILRIAPMHIFERRYWAVAQRAVNLNWARQAPPFPWGTPEANETKRLLARLDASVAWCNQWQGSVHVAFMGLVSPRPQDIEVVEHAAADPDMTVHVHQRLKRKP